MFPWQIPVIIALHLFSGYFSRKFVDKYPKKEIPQVFLCGYVGIIWVGAIGIFIAVTSPLLQQILDKSIWFIEMFGLAQLSLYCLGLGHKEVLAWLNSKILAINPA